jgi:hypothetical protein
MASAEHSSCKKAAYCIGLTGPKVPKMGPRRVMFKRGNLAGSGIEAKDLRTLSRRL